MLFTPWLQSLLTQLPRLKNPRARHPAKRRRNWFPLAAEILEERTLLSTAAALQVELLAFEAETDLNPSDSHLEPDGVSRNTRDHQPGYLTFGPYTAAIPAGSHTAQYRLLVDNNSADDLPVAQIEVYDFTADQIIAHRVIRRPEFDVPLTYQDFSLGFTNETDHLLEFRTFWFDTSFVRQDRVTIEDQPPPNSSESIVTFEAETQLNHNIGRLDADGWSANVLQDEAGFLNFGPYTPDIPADTHTATFRLLVDNTTADNLPVAQIEVYDFTADQILSHRAIRRQEFDRPFDYQDFSLDFTNEADHLLEFRTFWFDTSFVRQDRVRVDRVDTGAEAPSIAPPLDRSVTTTLAAAGAFLYTGSDPIQQDVEPETIEAQRAAVVRGQVTDRDGAPLPGVDVSILNHPEFGHTETRDDGMFDMAVNGGGPLTVNYRKDGFLTVQRQVDVPWQDFAIAPDVVLVPLDNEVTTIDLTSSESIQVARGSEVTDADGEPPGSSRRATLLFPQGTTAELVLPDGTVQPLETLNVRATEYTIGPDGPLAMPAELPPNSGYTYAVELSADEALAAGAIQVNFSTPVPFYVENFLDFPVGMAVPTGFYDRQAGVWIASDNGRVIEIIAESGGLAELDIDGDGSADDATALAGLGITDAEREQLAALYDPGDELWRVPIPHFSPWDCNWPFGPPEDAEAPTRPKPESDPKLDDPCEEGGFSIIECQNQILGERIDVTGTPFTLNYRSDRVPGRTIARTLDISLSGDDIPASLRRIDVEVLIAGRRFTESFAAAANLSYEFVWDGQDAYGRTVQGTQTATVRVGYVYEAVYQEPSELEQSFARFGGAALSGNRARQEFTIWQEYESMIGSWDGRALGTGGWSLDVHHAYDPLAKTLYLGDGSRRSAENLNAVITTVAEVASPFDIDLAVGPDGTVYFTDDTASRVMAIEPDGSVVSVAGTGEYGIEGEGGPATQAQLQSPVGIDVGPDGSLYIAEAGDFGSHRDDHRILRVTPSGILTTVADIPQVFVRRTYSNRPLDIAVAPDGTIYFSTRFHLLAITPDGTMSTLFDNDTFDGSASPPAPFDKLNSPEGVDVGVDGSLYIADSSIFDGIVRLLSDGTGEIVLASGFDSIDVSVAPDGTFLIADDVLSTIRLVKTDGAITTTAGAPFEFDFGPGGDGGPAPRARFGTLSAVEIAPSGQIYVADSGTGRIRRIEPTLPGFSGTEIAVASQDGSRLYQFDESGRHLKTLNALTGAVLYEFRYDESGRLTEIEDGDGNVTTIEHDGQGNPTAIVAPFGQRTELTVNADGYLASITNPADESVSFQYKEDGLLTKKTDARGNEYHYQYGDEGRLVRAEDPAGGFRAISRSKDADGFSVTETTAEGRTTTYRVEQVRNADAELTGAARRLTTFPDGTQTEAIIGNDGRQETSFADGTQASLLQGPDPRWGMQAPLLEELTITTPGGITQEVTTDRSVTLANPDDPLSVQTMTQIVTVNGRSFTHVFDVAANSFTTTSPEGREVIAKLNQQGRLVSHEFAGLDPVQLSYDDHGRPRSFTRGSDSDQRLITLERDDDGNVSKVTDSRLETYSFTYDLAGRLTGQVLPDGEIVSYVYDESGNLVSITPPGRPEHAATYTEINLPETYDPPDAGFDTGVSMFEYDRDRNLTSIHLLGGDVITLEYDDAGRVEVLTLPRGAVDYQYDPDTGRLTTITAPDGGELILETDAGLLLSTTWTGEVFGSVAKELNDEFRQASETVNGGTTIEFRYDGDGLLTQAGDLVVTRDAATGFVTQTTLAGATDERSFDDFLELAQYTAAFNGMEIFATEIERDQGGMITEKRETVEGVTTTNEYVYDANGRLTEVHENGTLVAAYTYDANGNRITEETPSETITASYDAQDRLLQYGKNTYTYTADGRLASKTVDDETTSYSYDPLGNLMQAVLPDGQEIDYVVDGTSRRIGKKVDGQLVQEFLYGDQLNPVAELDGAGNVVTRFVYGTMPHVPEYIIKEGATYRIIADHLGSVRLVVNANTGVLAQRVDYDAFGNVVLDTNPGFQPFGFAGGLYDRDTSLVRFGARDYDPEVGRWTVNDFAQRWYTETNLYTYALNNPVNYIDPVGFSPDDVAKIQQAFNNFVERTTASGKRIDLPGTLGGSVTNIAAFYDYFLTNKPASQWRWACGDQWDPLQSELQKLDLDDEWTFEDQQRAFGAHRWGKATSSNPDDPTLTIDPWKDLFFWESNNPLYVPITPTPTPTPAPDE